MEITSPDPTVYSVLLPSFKMIKQLHSSTFTFDSSVVHVQDIRLLDRNVP